MTINEIIDYVTHSPENTNPNVLKSMLGDISLGGQSSDLTCIPLELTPTETEVKLNKTWNEIYEAPETTIYYIFMDNTLFIAFAFEQNGTYIVQFLAPKALLESDGIESFVA